ncbi:MAG: TerB family tellurite resistance protein [Gammaproteobacteria bacterium]|nr:TerB family tellurite resistance protein [Gammaproteobacteria bacterium]
MLKAITSFFENHFSEEDDEHHHSANKLQLASAALMIELSKSDQEIDETETAKLVQILKERFELEQDDLDELITLAKEDVREATSLYQFTSLMNEHFNYGEKVQLVMNMWEVAFADGKIDRYEEHLIRKVAELLYLDHKDFILSKQRAREASGAD